MPGSNENFSHLLDAQQKKEAEEHAKKGQTYDTREKAVANVLAKADSPRAALEHLANISTPDQARKATLDAKVAAGTSLPKNEEEELEKIQGRLSANETVAAEALRKLSQAAEARRADYQSKPFNELKNDMSSLQVGVDAAKRQLDDATTAYAGDPNKIKPFQNAYDSAVGKFQEADDIFKLRAPAEMAKDAEDRAEDELTASNNRIIELQKLSVDKLYEKTSEYQADWNALNAQTRRINRSGDAHAKAAHVLQKNELYKRWNEANGVLKEKEAAEKKRLDKENEKNIRETLPSVALIARRTSYETVANNLATDLIAAETALEAAKAAGNSKDIADKQRVRNETAANLLEARNSVKEEEDAIKVARDRESKNVDSTSSVETMDIKSWNEYDALPPEQQAAYLEQVVERGDMTGMNFKTIKAKIDGHQDTTFRERAFFGAQFADGMLTGKISAKEFPRLAAGNADLFKMISQRVANSEQAKALSEKYGTKFEKLMNWAKKDYRWLMLLLLIIGGSASVIAGPVTAAGGLGQMLAR